MSPDHKLHMLTHMYLPSKCSEGCAGVWCPGDDKQQDNDEGNFGHLPFTLHFMEPLCRVSSPLTVDLSYRSAAHRHIYSSFISMDINLFVSCVLVSHTVPSRHTWLRLPRQAV